jgi:hypothetical protein
MARQGFIIESKVEESSLENNSLVEGNKSGEGSKLAKCNN